mmetsp:Transcript_7558/g.18637  ORF Transcript_7558/g.18637 Transcript_7558/m.18637 type:complete len:996 (+) Transcript_7558:676-3663(+)
MACEGPRATAEGCTGACECFPDGFQGFVDSVDGAFKKTQAFVMTTDPAYCSIASQNIDDEINLNYECCLDTCGGEMEEYVSCTFNDELSVAFGLVGCERTPPGGGGGGDGEGGIPMLYVIVGVVVLLLVCCCCCCGCYYRRRKINAAKKNGGGVNVNIDLKSESKDVTDSTTQNQNPQSPPPGGANSQNSKAETAQTSDTWDNPAFDVERPPMHQQQPPMYPPPPQQTQQGYPHGSQRDLYGGMDDWSRMEDSTPPVRGPPQRVSSRRSLRDIMDDDEMDPYNDQDDYGRSTRSRRKGRSLDRSTRSRSNRSLRSYDDDEDYDDDRDSRSGRRSRSKSRRTRKKDKKKHRSASRSRSLSSDTSSSSGSGTASRSRGKKKRAKEIEKARKLIEEHENTKKSKKKLDKEEKASANAEIKTMLDQLKKDRDAMEEKMKKAEEEAKKLKLEKVNSAKSLLELEMAEETNGMNSSGHMRRSAKKDAVKAELEAARQEREEMLALINQLEGAQMTMMQQSQHLRKFGMDDFEDDNKSMGVGSVFGLGGAGPGGPGAGAGNANANANATDELHRQLEETEEMTRNLKYEKKLKKLEIEQLKIMSNGQMTPDIDQAERDRREITKKLKRAQEQTASLHTQILRSQSQAMAQSQEPTFDPLLGSSRAELGLGGGSGHQRRRGSGHGLTQDQPNMNMGMGMMRTNSSNQLMGNSSFGNLMAAAGPGGGGGMGMGMIPGMDAGGFNPPMQQYGGAEGGYGMEVGYPNQQQLGPMAGMTIDSSTGMCIADDITMDEQLKDSAGTSSHDRKSRKKSKRDKKHSHSSSPSPTSPIREIEPSKPKEQDNRPSGWLGETIRRNSVKDLADLMGDDDDDDYGGGGRSTSYEPLGQSHRGGRSHNQLDPGGSSHGRSKKKSMGSSSHHRRSGSRDRNDDGIGGSSRHGRSHSKSRSSSRDTTSTHSRSGGSGKRDRARRAEKKLRDEMKRSRSSRSTRSFDPDSSMDSGDDFY